MLYPQRQVFTVPLGGAKFHLRQCLVTCDLRFRNLGVCYITVLHMLFCYKRYKSRLNEFVVSRVFDSSSFAK